MWLILVLPWASLLFLDKNKLRRYMPVALFAVVLSTLVNQIAAEYGWWSFMPMFGWDRIIPVYKVYGLFLVGTIWIFAFTFGKFWLYLIVNFLVDLFFMFFYGYLLAAAGISASGNLSVPNDLILLTVQGILIYGYQVWQEKIYKEPGYNQR